MFPRRLSLTTHQPPSVFTSYAQPRNTHNYSARWLIVCAAHICRRMDARGIEDTERMHKQINNRTTVKRIKIRLCSAHSI